MRCRTTRRSLWRGRKSGGRKQALSTKRRSAGRSLPYEPTMSAIRTSPICGLAWIFRCPLEQAEGPIAEASAALRRSAAAQKARELEVLSALEGAYDRYQVATAQLAVFEQGLLRGAEAALRAAESAYQLGERGILEVLDAQRVLRTVRLDFLNAQFDRQAALVDLDELRAVELRSKQ